MNQRFWNGILATFLAPGIGVTSFSYAAQAAPTVNQDSQVEQPSGPQENKSKTATLASTPLKMQPTEVLKVGEYQSPVATDAEEAVIAKIHPHEFQGRQAATLYVRSIPVLTFLGARSLPYRNTKMGEVIGIQNRDPMQREDINLSQMKVLQSDDDAHKPEEDPVWRARKVAAQLNQMSRERLDANAITVNWKAKCKCYAIKVKAEELVEIDAKTILADTTRSKATDALAATNRLRRLMGNAPPLSGIAGMPVAPLKQISLSSVLFQMRGVASWYGPGSDGTQSASGERFYQNALTAAHRSLPFGTKVRVINLNNGRSVVVRINDRGPFIRGRVIDLSTGAARVLGMMGTGIAPVRIEVLGTQEQSVFAQEN